MQPMLPSYMTARLPLITKENAVDWSVSSHEHGVDIVMQKRTGTAAWRQQCRQHCTLSTAFAHWRLLAGLCLLQIIAMMDREADAGQQSFHNTAACIEECTQNANVRIQLMHLGHAKQSQLPAVKRSAPVQTSLKQFFPGNSLPPARGPVQQPQPRVQPLRIRKLAPPMSGGYLVGLYLKTPELRAGRQFAQDMVRATPATIAKFDTTYKAVANVRGADGEQLPTCLSDLSLRHGVATLSGMVGQCPSSWPINANHTTLLGVPCCCLQASVWHRLRSLA